MQNEQSIIQCENLSAGYGDKPILSNINLEVRRGAITVLLGTSGCGKSTLLKTLIGLLPPLEGRVLLFGQDLYSLEPSDRTRILRRTGMLFQYGALFGSETVADNVALPIREHTELQEDVIQELVHMKLGLVGLSSLVERLPSEISGGQRKRVALARAVALDPDLLFADEPSAGLDPVSAALLDRLLRNFQARFGMTLLIVSHELESIRLLADDVIMLGGGKVLEQGSYPNVAQSQDPQVHDFFARQAPDGNAREGLSSLFDSPAVTSPPANPEGT